MRRCISCIIKICAVLLGIATVTLVVMSFLGIDLFDNNEGEKDDTTDIKPLSKRITRIKRNYTELKPID